MFRHMPVFLLVAATAALLSGCGGGHGTSDTLVTLRSGSIWVYKLTGTVTAAGGTKQNLQSTSTLTIQVASGTVNDANKQPTNILDRKFDLILLDGTEIKANLRLYYTQSNLGIFVHGINNYMGDKVGANPDKFIPSFPYQVLYLPNPLSDSLSISYANPFAIQNTPNGFNAYALVVGTGRQPVSTPAGSFLAKPAAIAEDFDNKTTFSLGNASSSPPSLNLGIVPDLGIVVSTLSVTLPDGTTVTGGITLQSANP